MSAARKKGLFVLLHVLAWFILLIVPQIIISWYSGKRSFNLWNFYFYSAVGIIFYFNYLWLVPGFYFKEKKIVYFVIALIVIIGIYFVLFYSNRLINNAGRDSALQEGVRILNHESQIRIRRSPRLPLLQTYQYSIVSIIITGFALGLRVIEKHSASEKHQKELEKEKLNSELAFLKNQVSPHFFFNTLNNIYSLIEVNAKDAQDAVMKLSRLMRYLYLYSHEN